VGFGLVRGSKLKANCALATTVSHDCHNLIVIGTSDEAMALVANRAIALQGGIILAVDGKTHAELALPLAGLMSLEPVARVAERIKAFEAGLALAGQDNPRFEMTATLLALTCIPNLHLSNRGYVELKGAPRVVPFFV
jgi:adenine deaminase